MAFDFSTLVTDRKQSDVVYVKQLIAKIVAGTATEPELAEWKSLTLKGAYNYTDLNRVSAAMEYLRSRLNGYGYATPGYKRIEVPHRTVTVSKLPEGFTELAYIQSSGTQYIDTEFIPTPKTKVEADIDFLSGNASFNCVFGVGQTSANQFVIYRNGSNMVGQVYSTKTYTTSGVTNTGRNNCVLSNSEFAYGAYSAAVTSEDFAYTYPLYLFALNSVGNATLLAHMKLYSNKIYDNDTIVRDYVPVKGENGNVGLYDLVEGKFYGNAGSGAFTGGSVVDPPVPSDPSDDETRDPFLWYEDDIPTDTQMAQYILNVAVIRDTMEVLSTTPAAPGDMEGLTAEEANAIEFILIDVQTLINNMVAAWFYSGDLYAGEV